METRLCYRVAYTWQPWLLARVTNEGRKKKHFALTLVAPGGKIMSTYNYGNIYLHITIYFSVKWKKVP